MAYRRPEELILVRNRRLLRSLGRTALPTGALAVAVTAALAGMLGATTPPTADAARTAVAGAEPTRPVHTQLEESRPADGDVLETTPAEIWLRFSTSVQVSLSGIELEAGGSRFNVLPPEYVAGTEQMQFRAVLADALPPGEYAVVWRTAGPDSHLIDGTFSFRVEGALEQVTEQAAATDSAGAAAVSGVATTGQETSQGVPEAAPGPDASADAMDGGVAEALAPIGLFSRWIYFLSIVLMLGVSSFRLAVVGAAQRRGEAELVADALRRLRAFGFIVAGVGLVAVLLRLVEQGRVLSAAGASATGLGAFLFASPWGLGWWLFLAAVLFFTLGVRLVGKAGLSSGGWRLATAASLLAVVTPALGGHAWGFESNRIAAVAADVVHVFAAGVWMGSLAVLVLVGLPVLAKQKDSDGRVTQLSPWVASFSRIALPAVLVLMATGVVSAWLHVGGPGALFSTLYGRTLLIKLAVLAGAAGIGFYNWRSVRPALAESGKLGLLRMPATVELILGVSVLAVTAVLVMLHPPF